MMRNGEQIWGDEGATAECSKDAAGVRTLPVEGGDASNLGREFWLAVTPYVLSLGDSELATWFLTRYGEQDGKAPMAKMDAVEAGLASMLMRMSPRAFRGWDAAVGGRLSRFQWTLLCQRVMGEFRREWANWWHVETGVELGGDERLWCRLFDGYLVANLVGRSATEGLPVATFCRPAGTDGLLQIAPFAGVSILETQRSNGGHLSEGLRQRLQSLVSSGLAWRTEVPEALRFMAVKPVDADAVKGKVSAGGKVGAGDQSKRGCGSRALVNVLRDVYRIPVGLGTGYGGCQGELPFLFSVSGFTGVVTGDVTVELPPLTAAQRIAIGDTVPLILAWLRSVSGKLMSPTAAGVLPGGEERFFKHWHTGYFEGDWVGNLAEWFVWSVANDRKLVTCFGGPRSLTCDLGFREAFTEVISAVFERLGLLCSVPGFRVGSRPYMGGFVPPGEGAVLERRIEGLVQVALTKTRLPMTVEPPVLRRLWWRKARRGFYPLANALAADQLWSKVTDAHRIKAIVTRANESSRKYSFLEEFDEEAARMLLLAGYTARGILRTGFCGEGGPGDLYEAALGDEGVSADSEGQWQHWRAVVRRILDAQVRAIDVVLSPDSEWMGLVPKRVAAMRRVGGIFRQFVSLDSNGLATIKLGAGWEQNSEGRVLPLEYLVVVDYFGSFIPGDQSLKAVLGFDPPGILGLFGKPGLKDYLWYWPRAALVRNAYVAKDAERNEDGKWPGFWDLTADGKWVPKVNGDYLYPGIESEVTGRAAYLLFTLCLAPDTVFSLSCLSRKLVGEPSVAPESLRMLAPFCPVDWGRIADLKSSILSIAQAQMGGEGGWKTEDRFMSKEKLRALCAVAEQWPMALPVSPSWALFSAGPVYDVLLRLKQTTQIEIARLGCEKRG